MPVSTAETQATISGIDSHAHVFLDDFAYVEGRRYVPGYAATIERYRSVLQANGMSHGVLVQPSFLGTDNGYLLACLDRYPSRFRGVVVLDPSGNLDMLSDYHARGVAGVRANLIGKPLPDFTNQGWSALLKQMRLLDWHLEVQVECQRLAAVAEAVLAHGVRLVVDHFGRIDPSAGVRDPGFPALLALGASRRVWVKISGVYRISPPAASHLQMIDVGREAYAMLRKAFGTDRLLWGSDWPHTQFEETENYGTALSLLDAVAGSDSERHQLAIETARELFHF